MRWFRVACALVLFAGLSMAVSEEMPTVAAAGSVVVGDEFACSRDGLAAAIDAVATDDADDPGLVTFDCADPVIEMTSDIQIGTGNGVVVAVVIDGSNGGDQIVLDGLGTSRMFSTEVHASLSLAHLTLRNGNAPTGGAIFSVNGSLTLLSCSVINNTATTAGAIFVAGNLSIEGSLFSGNETLASGGAIYFFSGSGSIARTSFYRNHAGNGGGAIYAQQGLAQIYASTFAENTADDAGSTIYLNVAGGAEVELYQTTVVQPEGENTPALSFGQMKWRGVILGGNGIHCQAGASVRLNPLDSYSNSGDCDLNTFPDLGLGPLTTMMVDGVQQYFYPLLETSAMIDRGPDSDCYPTNLPLGDVDQLGVARPLGEGCDIGAIERPDDYQLCVNRWNGAASLPGWSGCDRTETLLEGPLYPWPVLCVNQWNGAVRVTDVCGRSERSLPVMGDRSIELCANVWNGSLRVSDRCSRSEREVWI